MCFLFPCARWYPWSRVVARAREKVMKPCDRARLPKSVAALYKIVGQLQKAYPGRPFTPDAHLVGSIGEVVARETFGFELYSRSAPLPSHRGHDRIIILFRQR